MKSLIPKITIAALGLTLAAAPLAASAEPYVGVRVHGSGYAARVNPGGPCYGCGRRAWAPPPPAYAWHPNAWYPAPVVYYDGFYGWAPAGFYGWYWHGNWYAHRRFENGLWIYF